MLQAVSKRKDQGLKQVTHQSARSSRFQPTGRRRAIEVGGLALFAFLAYRVWDFTLDGSSLTIYDIMAIVPNGTGTNDLSMQSSWQPTEEWLIQCANQVKGNPEIVKPFCNGTESQMSYRLGDCIKACRACDPKKFPGSMAKDYSDRACPDRNPNYLKWGNLSVVDELFALREHDKTRFVEPDQDTLVIHLRLGDIVEKSKTRVHGMLTKGGDPAHHKTNKDAIKSVYEFLSNIQESGFRKVSIVGGSHKPEYYKKSRVYATCVERALRKTGLEVTLELDSCDPDRDFYYISHASKIVVSGGAFSRLMGQIVEHRGGKLIGRQFIPENYAREREAALGVPAR